AHAPASRITTTPSRPRSTPRRGPFAASARRSPELLTAIFRALGLLLARPPDPKAPPPQPALPRPAVRARPTRAAVAPRPGRARLARGQPGSGRVRDRVRASPARARPRSAATRPAAGCDRSAPAARRAGGSSGGARGTPVARPDRRVHPGT